jgi:hypothetical protein
MVEAVSSLNVAKLKDQLKRRGRSIVGKKGELQDRLREAILLNVPVASEGGDVVCRHESTAGMDVTVYWELLTPEDVPIPLPENRDLSHRPPMELEGQMPKVCNEGDICAPCIYRDNREDEVLCQSWMMVTHSISISVTSLLIQSSLRRDIAPCTAGFFICSKTCVRAIIVAQWTTCLIL